MHFDIRRGMAIGLGPKPQEVPIDRCPVSTIGLFGDDYPNVIFDMVVKEGDRVCEGQTVCVDRHRPEICFVSNGSGRVSTIKLGPRRRLEHLEIALDGDDFIPFDTVDLRKALLQSGAWTSFRSRPFGLIPDPASTPAAIFVSATEATSQAPDPCAVIATDAEDFQRGAAALLQLTTGVVFICQRRRAALVTPRDRIKIATFSGPYPSGRIGPQIHRLMPASRGRVVWEIGYQDVMAIGHLLATGRIKTNRTITVTSASQAIAVQVPLGAKLSDAVQGIGPFNADNLLSGSRLEGRKAKYLRRGDLQMTAIETAIAPRPFWHRLMDMLPAVQRGATVPMEVFERVFPFDILPTPLMRALAIGDVGTAERLGCLELLEEDMATLSQRCPSGSDYGRLLRHTLNQLLMENDR